MTRGNGRSDSYKIDELETQEELASPSRVLTEQIEIFTIRETIAEAIAG